MSREIKRTFFYLIIALLTSCYDEYEELGNGYYYDDNNRSVRAKAFMEPIYPVVTDYKYDEKFILVCQKPSREGHVIPLCFDLLSQYRLLATAEKNKDEMSPGQYEFYKEELIKDSSLYRMMSTKVSLDNTQEDWKIGEGIVDSLIDNDPYYQNIFSRDTNYWIIDQREAMERSYPPKSILYGPFSKEDYLKKKIELGVSNQLKLDFEWIELDK